MEQPTKYTSSAGSLQSIINLNLCYHISLMRYFGLMRYNGNNFETKVHSILEHLRTKLTKTWVPHGRFSKIYYFEANQNFSTTPR